MLEIESKKLKGTYRCQFYHDHEKLIAGLDEGKNSSLIYQKSVAIKKAINDMLFQKKTEDEALVELKEAFDKVGYATPETFGRIVETDITICSFGDEAARTSRTKNGQSVSAYECFF